LDSKQVQWCLAHAHRSPVTLQKALICLPNIAWGLFNWGEADYVWVSKNRYLTEVEIKVSVNDFKADGEKYKWKKNSSRLSMIKRFYYCVPEAIAGACRTILEESPIDEIREAGLLIATIEKGRPNIQEVKPSRINPAAKKLDDKQIDALWRLGYYRYWSLFDKFIEKKLDNSSLAVV
jgi:hypothetical protein